MSRVQTILLSIIAACLIVIVVVYVVSPIMEERRANEVRETFDEIGSGLD